MLLYQSHFVPASRQTTEKPGKKKEVFRGKHGKLQLTGPLPGEGQEGCLPVPGGKRQLPGHFIAD